MALAQMKTNPLISQHRHLIHSSSDLFQNEYRTHARVVKPDGQKDTNARKPGDLPPASSPSV